jgi:hypothetical protein
MCRKRWDELTFCVKLKGASDDEARAMMRTLLAEQRTTIGTVWQRREVPPAEAASGAPSGGMSGGGGPMR